MRPSWLTVAAALIAGAAHANPLTYDAALRIAEQSGPSLQAKAADVQAARAAAVAAGRLPDPRLTYGLENFPVSGPAAGRFGPESMTMASVGIMQEVPSGAKRTAERQTALADVGAMQAGQDVELNKLRVATALAWIDLFYAERRLSALDEVEKALGNLRQATPAALESGAVMPAKALEPQRLIAQLDDRRAQLLADVGKARAELVRWTGDPSPDVAGGPPPDRISEVALRQRLGQHPVLESADARIRQGEAGVRAAEASKHPDWSWQLSYSHRDPRWGDMISLGGSVTLPLFAGKRQDPIISARRETVSGLRSEREAVRRQLTAELDADLAQHRAIDEQLRRARDTFVPLAQRQADLARASYAGGTGSLTDTLQALVALADARVDAIDREAAAVRDAVRINLAYEAVQP